MKSRHATIILFFFIVSTVALSAQVVVNEKPLTKKELRAKRKKAKEIQKINKIHEVRRKAKELLVTRDFVVKDDGRSGVSGTVSFFKIHGDTITIQNWSNGQVGTSLAYERGARKVIGDIQIFEIVDNGIDQPLQAFIQFSERLTFTQSTVSVYIFGNRIEAAGIRGYFSNVADANIFESGIRSSNRGSRVQSARTFGTANRERGTGGG